MKIIFSICALVALTSASDTDLQRILKTGNDKFTAQMFSEVVKANPDKSVVLSAFSVLTPLAQLALASVGESHDELLNAIGFANDNITKAVFTQINSDLRSVKGVTLKVANKIYISEANKLNDNFAAVSKDVFNSEVQNLNFAKNQEAAATINAWVEDHTNQRIKQLIEPQAIDGTTQAILVNAIYFKGSWKDKFNKKLTENRPFHVNKDETIQTPTMYKREDFLYGESAKLDAKLIEIPYEGDESSFLIVLPNKIDGIAALQQKLKDLTLLEEAQKQMYSTEVDLYLPKFKIETTTNLKQVLQNMNIKKIFHPAQARLDNLLESAGSLYVSDAIQKAFIEVNEEGAEAAAANAFYIVVESLQLSLPLEFKADRPFYYVLRRKAITLFNGVVYEPEM